MIRSIIEQTGVKIDVSDDGRVNIASSDGPSAQRAIDIISGLTASAEMDKIYLSARLSGSRSSAHSSKSSRAPMACCTFRKFPNSAFATCGMNSRKAISCR